MALQEYECPACGGAMEFNPKTQRLKCPYCDSEFDVKDYVANHNSNSEGEAVESDGSDNNDHSEPLFIYKCGSCGGEILAAESLGSTKCPFCSNNVVVKEKFTGKFSPDYIIPFKLTREDAMETYRKHVKSKRLVPKVFLNENHVDELKGIYVPFWLYSATESFSGQYECTKVRTWSDSKYNYTETKYYDVVRQGTEDFANVPVDGSKEMPDDLMESLEPFDTSTMVPFNMGYLAGFLANKYNVDAETDKPRAMQRMRNSVIEDFKKTINQYSSVRPINENVGTVSSNHKYALYPVYILNTSWKGTNYLFAMNGQSGKFVGNLPFSITQALKYYIPIAAISSLVAFIIYYLFI
jgi:DNA-directed RNA polymerase subunit RPC12/RpoP